jgi:hypothetical protein
MQKKIINKSLERIAIFAPLLIGFIVWIENGLNSPGVELFLISTLCILFFACASLYLFSVIKPSLFQLLFICSWWLICIAYVFKFIAIKESIINSADLEFLTPSSLYNFIPTFSLILLLFLISFLVAINFLKFNFKISPKNIFFKDFDLGKFFYRKIFNISFISLVIIYLITSSINLLFNVRSGGQDIEEIQLPFRLRGILLNLNTAFPGLFGGMLLISSIRQNSNKHIYISVFFLLFLGLIDVFVKSSKGALISWFFIIIFAITSEYYRFILSGNALPNFYKKIIFNSIVFIIAASPLIYLSYHFGSAFRLLRSDFIDVSTIAVSDIFNALYSYIDYLDMSSANDKLSITSIFTPQRLTGSPSALASFSYGFGPFNENFFEKLEFAISQVGFHFLEYFGSHEIMKLPQDITMGLAMSTLGFLYVYFGIVGVLFGGFIIFYLLLNTFSKFINSNSVLLNSLSYSFPIFAIGFILEGSILTMIFSIIPIYIFCIFLIRIQFNYVFKSNNFYGVKI